MRLARPRLPTGYAGTLGAVETPYIEDTVHLNGPGGLTIDNGNLWIAECEGRRLLKYTADGQFLQQIGRAGFAYPGPVMMWCPRDVAVDSGGNIWFADSAHHIAQFGPAGQKLQEWGSNWNAGPANDQFNNPASIAFDAAGHVFVSDSGNHRIQVFSSTGQHLRTIGQTGVCSTDSDKFCYPQRMVIVGSRLYRGGQP